MGKSTAPPPLTPREALSGVLGSISLACWLFLLLPQLIENYRNSSADAISLAFLFVWFLGDIANLWGAIWAGLVPTVIAIAVYFCISDGVLIGQVLYYQIRNKRREGKSWVQSAQETAISDGPRAQQGTGPYGATDTTAPRTGARTGAETRADSLDDEEQPLLSRARTRRSSSITIPGAAKRRPSTSTLRRRSSTQNEPLAKILEESDERGARLWFKNFLSILAIGAVGTVGWAIAYGSGAWKPTPVATDLEEDRHMATGAQVLGYLSAAAYLGARIPQIIKNWRDQSCEGKSNLHSPIWQLPKSRSERG